VPHYAGFGLLSMARAALSVETPQAIAQAAPISAAGSSTYGEILQSSALIGAASALTVVIGVVRVKAMAILLGPAGIGLLGLYNTIADLARGIAAMGINGSGVRQIAEAAGTGDVARIARTVTVLRRTTIVLGVIGAALLVIFSSQVATLTFGTDQHAYAVALLSLVVLFRLVADGQGALIQGMRRIGDLARMGVLGALLGTIISIAIIYVLQEDGVVPSLIAVAAMSVLMSWWYSRKVQIRRPSMTSGEVRTEAGALLKLGVAFMASGLFMLGAAYTVRMIVLRNVGLDATGLYEAAWTLGGLYVGFVLQTMGTDFYPRLVGVVNNNAECNRLVNEQTQVSMLLTGPGVIATLTFAPLVIEVFYSTKFEGAVEVLRWICLGMTLRVITWPMGYIIVAKGRQVIFFAAELAWTVVSIALAWICVQSFGLNGAGIAFFGAYVFHALMIYPIVRWLSGFRWSSRNFKIGPLFLFLIAMVFCASYALPPFLTTGVGALVMIASSVYSIRALVKLLSLESIPRPLLQLLARLHLRPAARS